MLIYGLLFLLGYIGGYVSCDMIWNLGLVSISNPTAFFQPSESSQPMTIFILAGLLTVGLVQFYCFRGEPQKCVQALAPLGLLIIIPLGAVNK